jgi:Right handed beta helix region
MQGKHWLIVVSIVLGGVGCKELNREYYCPIHVDDPDCARPPDTCGNIMCAAPTPVCDTQTTSCVECLVKSDCARSRPVCTDQYMCVQCQSDDDCESKLCLTGGACADPRDVTYVGGDNTSDNLLCEIGNPCQNLAQGLRGVTLRKYIKLTGVISHDVVITIDNKKVDIYGRSGARISNMGGGEVLIVKGTTEVTMFDLEIMGNTSVGGKDCVEIYEMASATLVRVNLHNHGEVGISMTGTGKLVLIESQVHDNKLDGVKVMGGGTLELRGSTIYGHRGTAGVLTSTAGQVTIESSVITTNTGTSGGVQITGPFTIRNSIISANGNIATTNSAGGLTLNPVNAANAKFEFNTVADNVSSSTTSGLSCSNVSFNVSNSIFTGNTVNNCNVSHSLLSVNASGTNKAGDPMFVSRTLLDPKFYRIGSASAARDSADPAATLNADIDGQSRDDARKDMGADEFR